MSMKKNVSTRKGGASTGGVGAPTTYSYGKGSKRNNLTPPKSGEKSK